MNELTSEKLLEFTHFFTQKENNYFLSLDLGKQKDRDIFDRLIPLVSVATDNAEITRELLSVNANFFILLNNIKYLDETQQELCLKEFSIKGRFVHLKPLTFDVYEPVTEINKAFYANLYKEQYAKFKHAFEYFKGKKDKTKSTILQKIASFFSLKK